MIVLTLLDKEKNVMHFMLNLEMLHKNLVMIFVCFHIVLLSVVTRKIEKMDRSIISQKFRKITGGGTMHGRLVDFVSARSGKACAARFVHLQFFIPYYYIRAGRSPTFSNWVPP